MFEAGGYGVALTVAPARPLDPDAWGPAPEGVTRRPARVTDLLDVDGFDDAEMARELVAVAVGRAKLAAYEAALVAGFAARRPQQSDLTEDQPGHGVEGYLPDRAPAGVSEFFADELAVVAGISRAAATALTERSLVLRRELPDTWAALADGLIDHPRANAIVKALGGQSTDAGGRVDPAVVGEVEAQALQWALAGETPVRLAERTAAALIAVDAAAADRRRRKAEQCMDVQAKATADGMGQLVADLPMPVAAACRDAVDGYARMAKADGDTRPIGQLRAQIMADLILRPWDTTREPVTAHLQVIAPLPGLGTRSAGEGTRPTGGDLRPFTPPTDSDTATVDGAPITAGQLRELLEQLDALCPGGLQAPTGGSLGISLTDPATGALRATVTRGELEQLVRRGCPQHGAASDCGCAVLDRPPPVDRYRPTPAQQRFVKARDRTCRHPGCRRPARWTEADHVHPHAEGGQTACENLCSLCRRHHRLKTHAPGWRFTMTDDGVLSVTTPSGVTRTTRPPGLRLPGELVLVPVGGPPPDPADDPPPF
ncbi:HNH endonuclease [Modestobacter italicus]|uniref:HNH endonuclease n=1 Tax=Modestobacter italicus (strain DSM 44449 / CECT 9708 / BC 501) TaxID=2732864 RepID=I4F3Y9_MODI5|nr:HNH endonuclease [Modestobacter marinus]